MLQDIRTVWIRLGRILLVCKMLGWVGLGQKFGPKSVTDADKRKIPDIHMVDRDF